jgi:argininosuccinate lyase
MAYTVSLPFDRTMWRDDIDGSRAHVRGLERVGLLPTPSATTCSDALDRSRPRWSRATFAFVESDEDIHTAVERRVTELAGPAGGQAPHRPQPQRPGGHRPAAVVQARAARRRRRGSSTCSRSCSTGPIDAGDAYLPGYTHLQRAQPVLLAHHLLAHGWALARDVDRCSTPARLDVSPLGAGALAGSSLPLDPVGNAADLGFAGRVRQQPRRRQRPRLRGRGALRPHPGRHPPLADRRGDGAVDLRRVRLRPLDDAYATGSSMLPQKKNPDIAELARGKSGA